MRGKMKYKTLIDRLDVKEIAREYEKKELLVLRQRVGELEREKSGLEERLKELEGRRFSEATIQEVSSCNGTPSIEYLFEFGRKGRGEGEFYGPHGIAVHDSRVYITDWSNHRVQVFSLEGKHITSFGREGSGKGEFNWPYGIAVHDNRVYITDRGNDRIQVFEVKD